MIKRMDGVDWNVPEDWAYWVDTLKPGDLVIIDHLDAVAEFVARENSYWQLRLRVLATGEERLEPTINLGRPSPLRVLAEAAK